MNKLKKIINLLIVLSMLCCVLTAIPTAYATDTVDKANITNISADGDWVLSPSDKLSLTDTTVKATLTDGTTTAIAASELDWTTSDSNVAIESNEVTFASKGLHLLKATVNDNNYDVYFVSKDQDDTDYVIYSEDFDGIADGSLPDGWSTVSGTAAVKDKQLVLGEGDQSAIVIGPDWLSKFGNYSVEADVKMVSAANSSRWTSLMTRINDDNSNFFQMAVRKAATGSSGVEVAVMEPSGASNNWTVMKHTSYSEDLDPSKSYHFKIDMNGFQATEYINDAVVQQHVISEQSYMGTTGKIGFQTSSAKVIFDNLVVKVASAQPYFEPNEEAKAYPEIELPDTKLALAPATIDMVDSKDEYDKVVAKTVSTTTALMTVNKDLKVVASDDTEIASLDDAMTALFGNVIPAFVIKDTDTATAFANYMKQKGYQDLSVVSDSKDVLDIINKETPTIRRVFDARTLVAAGTTDAQALLEKANIANGRTILLPESVSTKDMNFYMQLRTISVWTVYDGAADDLTAIHTLIQKGPDGIITTAPDAFKEAYSLYNKNDTIIRTPAPVGHRGEGTKAPSNTILGFETAYQDGAKAVETDVRLSADGVLFMHHDGSALSNLKGADGHMIDAEVESLTWDEIRSATVLQGTVNDENRAQAKVPDIDEYFTFIKSHPDLITYFEIKTSNPNAYPLILDKINEYKIANQLVIIDFNTDGLNYFREHLPGVSCAVLTGGPAQSSKKVRMQNVSDIMKMTSPKSYGYDSGFPNLDYPLRKQLAVRGTHCYGWTYDGESDFIYDFNKGIVGLTTDSASFASKKMQYVTTDKNELTVDGTAVTTAKLSGLNYQRETSDLDGEVVVISGGDCINTSGLNITAAKNGEAVIMLRYTQKSWIGGGADYYTMPIKVTVTNAPEAPVNPGQDDESSTTDESSKPVATDDSSKPATTEQTSKPATTDNNSSKTNTTTNTPKTGDGFNPTALLLFVASCAVGGALVYGKKKIK